MVFAGAACSPRSQPSEVQDSQGWREFQGTWNATGTRSAIPLGDGRTGAIVKLNGSMLLSGPGRPGVGFLAETIAISDSSTGLVGRSVWTDENGDQVYSELTGEGTAASNHLVGKIIGGTGRFAGISGIYEFSWQFVVESDDGEISGRAVGLKGRFRTAQPSAGGQP